MVFQFVSFHGMIHSTFFWDRASALGYRKASVETSEGNCGESWARYGVLETRWRDGGMVDSNRTCSQCSHPAPHTAGTSQDTFPGFSPGVFLPDPLTCSRDTARVTGKYLLTGKNICWSSHSAPCCLRCNVTQTQPDWFQAPATR